MFALIASVLAASLLGSFHCAGMCGAFVALACGATETARSRQVALQAAYHLGRLATYLSLGLAAGWAGKLADLTGALAGLRSAAAVLAAGTMVCFALLAIARAYNASLPRPHVPAAWLHLMQTAHRAAMNRTPVARAVAIGLLTTLLPCGWLYAFVITAAGTASPILASVVMFTFWLGTLPALTIVGVSVRGLLGPASRHLPVVTAISVAFVAVYVLVGRAGLDPAAMAAGMEKQPTAHSASIVPDPSAEKACCKKDSASEEIRP